MKNNNKMKTRQIIFLLIIMVLSGATELSNVQAQQSFQLNGYENSNLFQSNYKIGVNTQAPQYTLDVYGDIGCRNRLLFIAQTEAEISMVQPGTELLFRFLKLSTPPNPPEEVIPLRVRSTGIKVDGLIECNTFQLHDNAAEGRILVSDIDGYGIWTDGSLFHDDDWLIEIPIGKGNLKNLYLNPDYQKVGIGTDHPKQALHVQGGNILISKNPGEAPGSINGSIYFGAEVTNEYPNGEWGIEYYSQGLNYIEGLNFWKVASATNPGANFCLFLRNDGTVGMGTSETHGYKLAIAGKVLCEELKVKLVADWPDYVLDKKYNIPSLNEVEQFIIENNTLPDVPSAKVVREEGISVGEMNAILLKKVEELTLYVIAMEKEIEQLKAQNKNK